MNLEGLALKLLLVEPDKDRALQAYSELKSEYLSESFKAVLGHITSFYEGFGVIPSLRDLEVYRSRDSRTTTALAVLDLVDPESIDLLFTIEELANQHAQNTALSLIDNLLETVSMKDRYELLEAVSSIPLRLEESIHKPNNVFTLGSIDIFEEQKDIEANRMPSGISNQWDAEAGGYYKQELVYLGGKRGSGKSIICVNLCVAQSEQGNVSVYFTIEMTAREVAQRIISVEAQIPFSHLKLGTLTVEEKLKICKLLAGKFEGGDALLENMLAKGSELNFILFERELKKTCEEKDVGKIIIVDDKDLSLSTIDTRIASVKARYGDRFCMAVVDYVNQVVIDGSRDMYDWKNQIIVSKTLKNLARKHDVCVVSPYQIDSEGKARFAQGILDSCDVAQLIKVDDKDSGHIVFETTKSRSSSDQGKHRVLINWDTLRVDPREVVVEEEEPEEPKAKPHAAAELELR